MYGLCTSWREQREGRFFFDILLAGLHVLVNSISAEMQEAAELAALFAFSPCLLTISQKKKNVEISHCRVADKGENDSRLFAEWI